MSIASYGSDLAMKESIFGMSSLENNKEKMSEEKTDRTTRNIGQWVHAVIFDPDGVITNTAEAHARAWKQMFDGYLETLGQRKGKPYRRFDRGKNYLRYVDGKPRYDGVSNFLESRGIEIDTGPPDDPPRRETICGLGNRKNETCQEFIDKSLVKVFPAAVRLIRQLKLKKIKTAVVSSSKNCQKVLAAADIEDLFDVRVDGKVSAELGLAGKPAPDIFLKAAEELSVSPEQAVVVEDAIAGVETWKTTVPTEWPATSPKLISIPSRKGAGPPNCLLY